MKSSHGLVLALLPPGHAFVDEDGSLLAQGLLEDVCSELARFPMLRVISWMSAAAVAHLSDRELGERLGATHVLRSRVQRADERLRITATLVETAAGTQLWSEPFEGPLSDVFDIEDELVGRIAATLNARLAQTVLAEARRKPPDSLAAYELTLRGLALLREGSARADEEARALFRRALEVDPHYARAHAGLSLSWFNEWSCQFWHRFRENGRLAYQHAHRALELDDRDAMLHVVIGRIHLYHRRFEQAAWYFDRAEALCPNDAENLIELSLCQVFLGHPETGMELAERAMRLNPYHPNHYYAYAALPYFTARDFERALEIGGRAAGIPIVDIPAYTAIALAYLGRLDEAREYMDAYLDGFRTLITFGREPEAGEPLQWLLEVNPYRRQQDVDLIVEGFRLLEDRKLESTAGDPRWPPSIDGDTACLARQGEGWVVEFGGRSAVLPDLKGIHDIRRLLGQPGVEVHCLDLAGRGADIDDGAKVLDDRARREIRTRIRDLQDEMAEAETLQDLARAQRARTELDSLFEVLGNALGLGGRSRRLGSLSERARSSVTWRIRHALRRIRAVHEPLGLHLANSIRTGTFCCYRPERTMTWRFNDDRGRRADGNSPLTSRPAR